MAKIVAERSSYRRAAKSNKSPRRVSPRFPNSQNSFVLMKQIVQRLASNDLSQARDSSEQVEARRQLDFVSSMTNRSDILMLYNCYHAYD